MDIQESQAKVKELIDLKRQIKLLIAKEKELKEELLPFIKQNGRFKNDLGMVYYSASKGSETFSRKSVLKYLRDAYGEALADQVDKDCTKQSKPRETLYVKINDL